MIGNTQKRIIGALGIALIIIIFLVIGRLNKGQFEPSSVIGTIGIGVFSVLYILLRPFAKIILRAANIIGEDKDSIKTRPAWRLFVVIPISFILIFYILLGDAQIAVPSTLQFNIIIVSSTLGGLVLAAATISRGKRAKRRELISVAQKLIMATLLFIFFTGLIFIVELIGGIDPDSFEFTNPVNWFRGVCFWSALASCYGGLSLFSLGIIDLVIALTRMRKRLSA
jgi:hypothetical protein